jgi:twinkle protein
VKIACLDCGSSDAREVYEDLHEHCFACGAHTGGQAPAVFEAQEPKPESGMIPVSVMAIPKRGISEDTAKVFKVGYGERNGRKCQVYPYVDSKGRVVAQKVRYAGKQFEILGNGKNLPLFGMSLWRDGGRMVVITEGEVDCLSVSQAQANRWPVVSVPNGAQGAKKSIEQNLEWLEKFDRCVLMLDDDEPGRAAAVECASVLKPGKAFIATIKGFKDANEAHQAGQDRAIIEAMWNAPAWRPDAIVGFEDVWKKVLGWDSVPAVTIANSGLEKKIMGWRPGEITTYVAGTGTGKSTAVMEIAADLAKRGHRVGYISLEDGPEVTAMGLVSVLVSRRLLLETSPNLNAPDVRAAVETLQKNVVMFDSFGELDSDHLLAKMRFLAQGEHCEFIVLDHISIAVAGGDLKSNERQTIDALMKGLISLVRSTNVHVFAVCHLSRREGVPHEEGRKTTLADLRGSHGIPQASFNVIAAERDQQAEGEMADVTTIRVLKCRRTGRTGIAGYVRYDPQTGRQSECDAPKASAFQVQDDTGADDVV